ncbi:hypothetical protein OROHE_019789 [Orobanche hederae]
MGRLAPLSEEPNINEEEDAINLSSKGIMRSQTWRRWIKTHLTSLAIFNKRSNYKVLLSILGCPLFPVSALPKLPLNEGTRPHDDISCICPSTVHRQKANVDCFVLKLSANQTDLSERSDSTAEMIKHVIFDYFSQRNGLLVYLEDSYLTRIQSPGVYPTYWETTMSTKIEDYRTVKEVMIAHAGQTTVVITRFGDNLKTGSAITRLEETWSIGDVAFNVEGLSIDCFIPPKEVQKDQPKKNLDWRSPLH